MSETLEKYLRLQAKIEIANSRLLDLKKQLEKEAAKESVISGGYTAFLAAGKKSYRHKEAVEDAKSKLDDGDSTIDTLIEEHTTSKTTETTRWAEVTKALELDISEYANPVTMSLKIKKL